MPPIGSFTGFTEGTVTVAYNNSTNIITVSFSYTDSSFDFTTGLSCTINTLPVTITSGTGTGGNGTLTFSTTNTNNVTFFTQGYQQAYQLAYTGGFTSDVVPYYWKNAINSSNINLATSGNAFTAVDITSGVKSILLPPVASKPGYIYRFKIIGYASPYLLRISPYFSGFDNTTNLVFGGISYDSRIDGALSTIRLEGANYSIALVSDGINWSIITLYVSSILTPAVATVSTTSVTETTPKQVLFHGTPGVRTINIAPMRYSFIKYISIVNYEIFTDDFYIFFPAGKKVDDVTPGGSQTLAITLTIPVASSASIILTYANNQYYILGYYIFGTGDNITNNSSSTIGDLLSYNLTFSNNLSNATLNYELQPTIATTNYSIINIVKLNNDTSTVNTVTFNRPNSQSSSYFAITTGTNIQQLSISLSTKRYTCIWFAKYYNSSYGTIIIPVYYYLASAEGGGITP